MKNTDQLAQVLIDIYDRVHHLLPSTRTTSRKVLRYLGFRDESRLNEESASAAQIPFPAQWADDINFNPNVNAHWGEGVWA